MADRRTPWIDTTEMPWGLYQGKQLKDVPASYLLWLFEQPWIKDWPGLHSYLKSHEDQLMKEKRGDAPTDLDPEDFKTFEDYKRHL